MASIRLVHIRCSLYNDVKTIFTEPTGSPAPGQPQRYTYTNIASAYTQGLEGQFTLKLIDDLLVNLNYTLTDTRDRLEDRALPGRALHRGTFKLTYRHENWGFGLRPKEPLLVSVPFIAIGRDLLRGPLRSGRCA